MITIIIIIIIIIIFISNIIIENIFRVNGIQPHMKGDTQ